MRWGKILLVFQAIITLILGIVFLSQVFSLSASHISKLQIGVVPHNSKNNAIQFFDIKQRYYNASYILLVVSLMELIILSRLFT